MFRKVVYALILIVLCSGTSSYAAPEHQRSGWQTAQVRWETRTQDGLLLPNTVAPFEKWRPVGKCDGICRAEMEGRVKVDGDGKWLTGWNGALYDTSWTYAQGAVSAPLADWKAIEVGAPGEFHLTVYDVYGRLLLDAQGSGLAQYEVVGRDDLVIRYEGPPQAWVVAVYERQRLSLAQGKADRLLYAEGEPLHIPANQVLQTDAHLLNPYSGGKAARVCATWQGQSDLQVYLQNEGGGILGQASIPPGRRCGIVYGLVDKSFVVSVSSAADALLWELEVKGSRLE